MTNSNYTLDNDFFVAAIFDPEEEDKALDILVGADLETLKSKVAELVDDKNSDMDGPTDLSWLENDTYWPAGNHEYGTFAWGRIKPASEYSSVKFTEYNS